MEGQLTRYAVDGWGEGSLWTGEGLVLAHEFSFAPSLPAPRASGPPRSRRTPGELSGFESLRLSPDTARRLAPAEVVARLTAFLAGEDSLLDVALDLGWCTPFQRAVASVLRSVPRREVVTYGELAALAGYPGAQRAVGTFCARNRLVFLLPCHRVVAADGIGGYGASGIDAKRRLLALEGVVR